MFGMDVKLVTTDIKNKQICVIYHTETDLIF